MSSKKLKTEIVGELMKKAIAEKYLRDIVDELKRSANKHRLDVRPGNRGFGVYRYLEDIYRVYLDLRAKRIARKSKRKIAKRLQLSCNKNAHPIRVLIEASAAQEDNRAKSRWTQALKYALDGQQPPKRLKLFFEANGGISGAAAKLAVRDGTTRNNNKNKLDRRSFNQQKLSPVAGTPKETPQVANCIDRVLKPKQAEFQPMFVKLNSVK